MHFRAVYQTLQMAQQVGVSGSIDDHPSMRRVRDDAVKASNKFAECFGGAESVSPWRLYMRLPGRLQGPNQLACGAATFLFLGGFF